MCAIHAPWLCPNTTSPRDRLALAERVLAATRIRCSAEVDRLVSKMARLLSSQPSVGGAQSIVWPCGVWPDHASLPVQPQKCVFLLSSCTAAVLTPCLAACVAIVSPLLA